MKRTVAAWLLAIIGLLAYEMYAVLNHTPGDTLSEAVWKYGLHPMIPFAVGVLVGHFFWQRKGGKALLVVLAMPLLLGAERCQIELPQPTPSPTTSPVPTPTPEPTPTPTPEPTPTPTPEPTPTPTPEPPPGVCALPLNGTPEMIAYFLYPAVVDSTPRICNPDRCNTVGYIDRYCCPVALEDSPQRFPCEVKLIGGLRPEYQMEVKEGNLRWDYEDEWKARISGSGKGAIRSCYPNGRACSAWLEIIR